MLTQLARDLDRGRAVLTIAHPVGRTRDVLRRAAGTAGTSITLHPDVDAAVAAFSARPEERSEDTGRTG
jgi:sulfate permease, SulP family